MKKVFIGAVIIAILLIGGGFFLSMNNNKVEKSKKETPKEEEKQETKDDKTVTSTNTARIKTGGDDDSQVTSDNSKNESNDQYIIANGYAGASDNAYYTKNGVLYHERLSTNEKTKIAEGVKKIESDIGGLIAYKGQGFKIISEDSYVTYKD